MTSTDTPLASYINRTLPVVHNSNLEIGYGNTSRTSKRVDNHTLPIEILVYIFTLASAASPSIFDVENQALWNGRRTLTVVVSVCRLWRTAALGAQSLWSTIVLPSGSKQIVKCLEFSLYYSNKSLIDIFFFRFPGRRAYDNNTHKACEHDEIMDILSNDDVSSRLRTISNIPMGSLALNTHRIRREMGNLLRSTNQKIQAVGIFHWEHSTRSDWYPLSFSATIDVLGCLPSTVAQLFIAKPVYDSDHGITELLASPTLQSLWGRLSHLKITGPFCVYLREATEILRQCVILEKCHLYWLSEGILDAADMYGPLFDKERVILPHLRQLIIQSFDGDATYLLDAVSCPSIVNLAVKQNMVVSGGDQDHVAAIRWEDFFRRSFSMSPSPRDILREIWVHGLSTSTIEYLLSSHEVKSVHSIALARRGYYTLTYRGCPELSQYGIPSVPSLDLHSVYIEAAEEYGLPFADMLKEYDIVPGYGWNTSAIPLCLRAFALQCLEKANIFVDTPSHVNTPMHFTTTVVELD